MSQPKTTVDGPRSFSLSNMFYGWRVLFASCIIMGFSSGIVTYSATVFFIPVQDSLNLSRTSMSIAFSLARAENFILAPIVGYFIDRLGPRRPILFGITMAGIGLILFGLFANSLLLFILTWTALVSFGTNIGGFAPNWAAINNWFVRTKGRAMGIGMAAQSLGGVLIAPIVAVLITQVGWRTTAVICGIAIMAVVIPVSFIIRTRPSDLGLKPDGDPVDVPEERDEHAPVSIIDNVTNFTVRQATKTSALWFLIFAMGLRQFGQSGLIFHFSPLLQDRGFSPIAAGSTVGLLAFMGVIGAISSGWISDRFPRRRVMATIVTFESLALLLLYFSTEAWQVYAFVVILGFGQGAHALNRAILGEYFGQTSYAKIWGVISMATTPIVAMGPIFAGISFDSTGSYSLAIAVYVSVYAMAAFLYFNCRKPSLHVAETDLSAARS